MSDHREPVVSVIVPGPSSPNIPTPHSPENKDSFDKENVLTRAVSQSENSSNEIEKEVSPLLTGTSLEVNGNTTKQSTASPVCHSLTSVVPVISQQPSEAISIPSTSTLAHSVVSLLPKVSSPLYKPSSYDTDNILKPSALVNLQSLSRGTTSRPRVPVAETVPDFIPEFLPGKIDAKRFPPKHYDFRSLEIGSWKYETKSMGFFTPTTARLKVIFTQRKFVYEFEIRPSNDVLLLREKQMASIEVPFSSIVGLNISKDSPCEVTVEVNSAPVMFIGKQQLFSPVTGFARQTKYDTSRNVDYTGGQMSTSPYHKILLSSNQLRSKLQSFDPRFDALIRTPITMDVTKRLVRQGTPAVVKHHRKSTNDAATPVAKRPRKASTSPLTGEIMCSCSSGCNTQRCSCVKVNGKCGTECKCTLCKNPLNILLNNGVDVAMAKEDACLMQNITKIEDLDSFLKKNIERTPCCDVAMPMKDICVGEIECPECDGEYRYSWCTMSLHDEENRPRNHCAVCKRCGDYRDVHCDNCNKCYFAGRGGSFNCRNCSPSYRPDFIDSLSAFLSVFHDPQDDSDNEYY